MNGDCAECGGAATLILTEGPDRIALCVACVDRKFPELRLGSFKKQFMRPRKTDGACPNCGWTQQKLSETGLLGCPLCYEALEVPINGAG